MIATLCHLCNSSKFFGGMLAVPRMHDMHACSDLMAALTCSPVATSHARTERSGDALSNRSPSVVHCTSSTAFLCPARPSQRSLLPLFWPQIFREYCTMWEARSSVSSP